jgi:paraquat-inducible protein B
MKNAMEMRSPRGELPKARVSRSRISWLFWGIPVLAAAFCVWLVYRDVLAKGPTITLTFLDASGLEPDNTPVRYRGATVGKVSKVELTPDHQHVRVTAKLEKFGESLARQGSIFWIVRPEVKLGSVSGLRTIVSGEYLSVQPGSGARTTHFVGAESPPIARPEPSLYITLLAPNLSSLQEQSPIYYRGIQVGEVLNFQLGNDAQEIVVRARIQKAYAPLVRRNTRFWNAGGLDISFSLFQGAAISATSPKALLAGAIQFATPPEAQEPATDGMTFRLYEKPEEIWKTWAPVIPLHPPNKAESTNAPVAPLR